MAVTVAYTRLLMSICPLRRCSPTVECRACVIRGVDQQGHVYAEDLEQWVLGVIDGSDNWSSGGLFRNSVCIGCWNWFACNLN